MRLKFNDLLTEAAKVRSLKEDMLPPATPPPPQQQPAPPATQQPLPPVDGSAPAAQPSALTVDAIIDRLNVIRGGKSFTEPETYKALSDFFNTVPQTDREIVDRFLTGLGSVVINAPGATPDPNQPNATQQQGQPPPAAPPPAPSQGAPAPVAPM